jgi:hypothetical protein
VVSQPLLFAIMNGSIINYFQDHLVLSLLVQGCFVSVCISIGLYLNFKSLIETLKTYNHIHAVNTLDRISKKFRRSLDYLTLTFFIKKTQTLKKPGTAIEGITGHIATVIPFTVAMFILLLVSGILSNRIGDTLLDRSNRCHLGLKSLFLTDTKYSWKLDNQKFYAYRNTDSYLKIEQFNKIYPHADSINYSKKTEIYYTIKHKLLENELWRDYLISTQSLINYSQVLLLSFTVLLYLLLLEFVIKITGRVHAAYKNGTISILQEKKFLTGMWSYIVLGATANYMFPDCDFIWLMVPGLVIIGYLELWSLGIKSMRLLTRIIGISACICLYYASGLSWKENEKEFDAKVYGVFKTSDSILFKKTIAPIYNIDTLHEIKP